MREVLNQSHTHVEVIFIPRGDIYNTRSRYLETEKHDSVHVLIKVKLITQIISKILNSRWILIFSRYGKKKNQQV